MCLRVVASDPVGAEIAAAEAWEAGASGVVEDEGALAITVYAPAASAARILQALADAPCAVTAGPPEVLEDVVWSEAWKAHLGPIEISPRLIVAPSFVRCEPAAGQRVVTIDPGQAFGTGAHHSTRLALEGIDAWAAAGAGARVLDIGTGSGVLALAALALGAQRAVGFDCDSLAPPAARSAARANGLDRQLDVFTGSLAALGDGAFDLVVANLLRQELLPLVAGVAARVERGGTLVLSGLLEGDGAGVLEAFRPFGLVESSRRTRRDADGECWLGLALVHGSQAAVTPAPARASPGPGRRPSR